MESRPTRHTLTMLLLLSALVLSHPALTVQTAQVDITPPERLPLGGYTERQGRLMDWGGDPLYARCVLFTCGSWKEAVVSAEMLTIPESFAREVRKRIPADVHLFLAATHTHCAPDSQMLNDRMTFAIPGIASYKSRWLDWYAEKIASCVTEAVKAKDFDIGQIFSAEFQLDMNRGRRAGAEPDRTAEFLSAVSVDITRRIPLLAEYAAHPVFFGPERNQTSGDWPGALSRHFPDLLVLVGALGDVSPHADGRTPEDRIKEFVHQFHLAMPKARPLSALSPNRTYSVWQRAEEVADESVPIQFDPVHPHPDFSKDYKIPQALAQTLADKFAPTSASITALRLGSLAIVGIPGEPTSHIGRQIKEAGIAMGFHSVLVISHVNGWIGYILDPADYSHGGYEADLSFYGPNEGEHVVDAAKEALRKLRAAR